MGVHLHNDRRSEQKKKKGKKQHRGGAPWEGGEKKCRFSSWGIGRSELPSGGLPGERGRYQEIHEGKGNALKGKEEER